MKAEKSKKYPWLLRSTLLGVGFALGLLISTLILLNVSSHYDSPSLIALLQVIGVCAAALITLSGVIFTIVFNRSKQIDDYEHAADMERQRREVQLRHTIYVEATELCSRNIGAIGHFINEPLDLTAIGDALKAARARCRPGCRSSRGARFCRRRSAGARRWCRARSCGCRRSRGFSGR